MYSSSYYSFGCTSIARRALPPKLRWYSTTQNKSHNSIMLQIITFFLQIFALVHPHMNILQICILCVTCVICTICFICKCLYNLYFLSYLYCLQSVLPILLVLSVSSVKTVLYINICMYHLYHQYHQYQMIIRMIIIEMTIQG